MQHTDILQPLIMAREEEFHFTHHLEEVLPGLTDLRCEGEFCDVTVCVEAVELRAHRIILAAMSDYFRAMFTGHLAECAQKKVVLRGVSLRSVRLLVDFAYSGRVTVTRDNVQELLTTADMIGVLSVREACWEFLQLHLDRSNCLGVYCLAQLHSRTDLADIARRLALRYFTEIAEQDDFLDLDQMQLVKLLSDDNLYVDSEDVVLQAALRWLRHSPQRVAMAAAVVEHVRVPLLSPDCLRAACTTGSAAGAALYQLLQHFLLMEARWAQLKQAWTHCRRAQRTVRKRTRRSLWADLNALSAYVTVTACMSSLICPPGDPEVLITIGVMEDKAIGLGIHKIGDTAVDLGDHEIAKTLQLVHRSTTVCTNMKLNTRPGYTAHGGTLFVVEGHTVRQLSCRRARKLAQLHTDRFRCPGVFVLGGRLYAVGGTAFIDRSDCELTGMESCPVSGGPCTREDVYLQHGLSHTACAVVANVAYIAGGNCKHTVLSTLYSWHKGATGWTRLAMMRQARCKHGMVAVGGCLYVVGGWSGSRCLASMERYDPGCNAWEALPDTCCARAEMIVTSHGDSLLVMGGHGDDGRHDRSGDVFVFNTRTSNWTISVLAHERPMVICAAAVINRAEDDSPAGPAESAQARDEVEGLRGLCRAKVEQTAVDSGVVEPVETSADITTRTPTNTDIVAHTATNTDIVMAEDVYNTDIMNQVATHTDIVEHATNNTDIAEHVTKEGVVANTDKVEHAANNTDISGREATNTVIVEHMTTDTDIVERVMTNNDIIEQAVTHMDIVQ